MIPNTHSPLNLAFNRRFLLFLAQLREFSKPLGISYHLEKFLFSQETRAEDKEQIYPDPSGNKLNGVRKTHRWLKGGGRKV